MKSKGLGDSIEKFTSATGIKKAVQAVAKATGSDCGCGKRQDTLNRVFPYKKIKMAYQKLQASRASLVTLSDTVDIPSVSTQNGRGNNGCVLYVGTGGDLRVLTAGGDDVVFTGFPDGGFLPVNVVRVFLTNTTASNIVSLW